MQVAMQIRLLYAHRFTEEITLLILVRTGTYGIREKHVILKMAASVHAGYRGSVLFI